MSSQTVLLVLLTHFVVQAYGDRCLAQMSPSGCNLPLNVQNHPNRGVGSSCFIMIHKPKSYEEAQKFCFKQKGGRLALIKDGDQAREMYLKAKQAFQEAERKGAGSSTISRNSAGTSDSEMVNSNTTESASTSDSESEVANSNISESASTSGPGSATSKTSQTATMNVLESSNSSTILSQDSTTNHNTPTSIAAQLTNTTAVLDEESIQFWVGLQYKGDEFVQTCPVDGNQYSAADYLEGNFNGSAVSANNKSQVAALCLEENMTSTYCWYTSHINGTGLVESFPFICEIKQPPPTTTTTPAPVTEGSSTVTVTVHTVTEPPITRNIHQSPTPIVDALVGDTETEDEDGISTGALVTVILVGIVVVLAAAIMIGYTVKMRNEQLNETVSKIEAKPGGGKDVEAAQKPGAKGANAVVAPVAVAQKGVVGDAAIPGGPGGPGNPSTVSEKTANDEASSGTMKSASEKTVNSSGSGSKEDVSSKDEASSKDESGLSVSTATSEGGHSIGEESMKDTSEEGSSVHGEGTGSQSQEPDAPQSAGATSGDRQIPE